MRVRLVEKIPVSFRDADLTSIRKHFLKMANGLDVVLKEIVLERDKLVEIEFTGGDQAVFYRMLEKDFGLSPIGFSSISINQIRKGFIVDLNKVGYGVYIDLGIRGPPLDALYPLYSMRAQLCDGNRFSVKKIVREYGLEDGFPLEVRIVGVDEVGRRIWVELSERQLEKFKEWRETPFERIFVFGVPRRRLDNILKTGYGKEVVNVDSLSLAVHMLTLKIGIEGEWIARGMESRLKGSSSSTFKPAFMEEGHLSV